MSSFGRVGTAFSGELPEARTVLLLEIFLPVVKSNAKFAPHIACCA